MPDRIAPTVIVYVDGFALYKAMLQHQFPEFKWLDLEALARHLFPHHEVVSVKYFTAQLKPLTDNPGIGQRQQVYWRAFRSTKVEIFEGKFVFNRQNLPLHPEQLDASGKVRTVKVKRPEEKGSDVALASHLIIDALENQADSYAVVTNDSDLVPPMRLLTARGKSITLVSVAGEQYNKAFDATAIADVRTIRRSALAGSQFPTVVLDREGRAIRKPPTWL